MSTEDLSRFLFQPKKRYAGVRMQQGRVLTDADINDLGMLQADEARRARVDIIGPSGSPDTGFRISGAAVASGQLNFTIGAGTIYVGGIRVELEADTTFAAQHEWLGQVASDRNTNSEVAQLVYLEVWQQSVSAVEDDELLEKALGGPDTTTRVRTMARVRRRAVGTTDCGDAWNALTTVLAAQKRGTFDPATSALVPDVVLKALLVEDGATDDMCSPAVTSGYLGAENAAIRVQLVSRTDLTKAGALTWGFDNASPLYRVTVSGSEVTFVTQPKDQAHWPLLGQVVELLPWSAMLDPNREIVADGHGRAAPLEPDAAISEGNGYLTKLVSSYDPTTSKVTLETAPGTFNVLNTNVDSVADHEDVDRSYVYMRIWNRGSDLGTAARLHFGTNEAVTLGSTGLQVVITGNDMNADAHWILSARPNTPTQLVPWEALDDDLAPSGVTTYLCPLAVLVPAAGTAFAVHDCRETFRPLTRIKSCATYTVGDGDESHGDFTSIQAAIDNLPPTGGRINILRGTYEESIVLRDRGGVELHGCGGRSHLNPTSAAVPAIQVIDCQRIEIQGLSINSPGNWGIAVEVDEGEVKDIRIRENVIISRDRGAICVYGAKGVEIVDNDIDAQVLDDEPVEDSDTGRLPAIFVQGGEILVERNRLTALVVNSPQLMARSGIQIGGSSADVIVRQNIIKGGNGNGVTLGSVHLSSTSTPSWQNPSFCFSPLYSWDGLCLKFGFPDLADFDLEPGVEIEPDGPLDRVQLVDNDILDMQNDGIGVAWFFGTSDPIPEEGPAPDLPDYLLIVEDLLVADNRISRCARAEPLELDDFLASWSGHGGIVLPDTHRAIVRDNTVTDCGVGINAPNCGIFVLSGSGLTITGNRLSRNGYVGCFDPGWQGGIVALNQYAPLDSEGRWDGTPTLSVANNVVSANQGPALYAAGVGPMAIADNQLTSIGRLFAGTEGHEVAAGVHLLNSGTGSEVEAGEGIGLPISPADAGSILFTGNTVLVAPPPAGNNNLTALSTLYSNDDIQVHGNVFRADLRTVGDANIDLLVHSPTATVQNNRFQETTGRVSFSAYVYATRAGMLQSNLGTHCFYLYDVDTASIGANRSIFGEGDNVCGTKVATFNLLLGESPGASDSIPRNKHQTDFIQSDPD